MCCLCAHKDNGAAGVTVYCPVWPVLYLSLVNANR